jgi:hypothetical protein
MKNRRRPILGAKPMKKLFDHYRPELHYMRGPGPKWIENHGRIDRASLDAKNRDNNASTFFEVIAEGCESLVARMMHRSRVDK